MPTHRTLASVEMPELDGMSMASRGGLNAMLSTFRFALLGTSEPK